MAAPLPARFADLKRDITASYPDFEERITKAWGEIIAELQAVNAQIAQGGQDYIPQVKFADLHKLGAEDIDKIKRRGTVVIRDVVPDAEAIRWKELLEEFVKANPDVEARAHPNILATSIWLNNLYHTKDGGSIDGVDLSTPLTYADRFRIRRPGGIWGFHPPHVDSGAIERWEDPIFRRCFASILSGDWRSHDPYELDERLNAASSRYGRPNQSTVFKAFQGWLAMSETAPTQGTLRVFPDVLLSNAYIILRPFFRPAVPAGSAGFLEASNWEFDISSPDFPGISPRDGGYDGPQPTPALHPHLELEKTMTSVPKVYPGDTVFWHCDVVHSVEQEHTGAGDSAVMYIPSVPLTPINQSYVERQKEAFLQGQRPPDFPKARGEESFVGLAGADAILAPIGRRAMGLPISVA
ncbi:hypothetical protein DXG03_008022 [Asterophora parasitica]|uniref:DUF1479-domain-containing protein n=1 Tax=Asterophora parasitica TaxID=117018 RepID=A0A9P7KD89_9AGAR|nr:hypothetical protein DXG03_008022 [Asterophora parasitica]